MRLSNGERLDIATWMGWKRQYRHEIAGGGWTEYTEWVLPGYSACCANEPQLPAIENESAVWVPLFERLAALGAGLWRYQDGVWVCCVPDEEGAEDEDDPEKPSGHGKTPGEAVCQCVLVVIATEQAAQDLSKAKPE